MSSKKTKLRRYSLANGLTILHDSRESEVITIQITIKIGSIHETKEIAGISHYLEHLLFEGTKKRKDSKIISNEIESRGGNFNAYTTNERTAYYVTIHRDFFDVALDVLADMMQNSTFNKKPVETERKVILDEINLVTDEPRNHQWILFFKTLFQNHPVKNPTYGTVETMKSINKPQILDYYTSYYVPNNMIVTVVGNIKNLKSKILSKFKNARQNPLNINLDLTEPAQTSVRKIIEQRKIQTSYLVFGYKTVPRQHKDSYVFDIIKAILGRGQSGRLFYEIRTKNALAYEIGCHNDSGKTYGAFCIYLSTNKKNINKALAIVQKELKKMKQIAKKDLEEAKTFLIGNLFLQTEDSHGRADLLSTWETISKAEDADNYLSKIKKVSIADVRRVAKRYFTKNYSLAIVMQK